MDRREFLKTTFAASAATVALGPAGKLDLSTLRSDEVIHVEPDGQAFAVSDYDRGFRRPVPVENGTTDLSTIAQALLVAIATRLESHGWATTLHEHQGEPLWNTGGPRDRAGYSLGHVVPSYEPGAEHFVGMQPVSLAHQVGALWEVPSRLTGGRREFYQPMHDRLQNIAELEALPVALAQLDPVVAYLTAEILAKRVNVFSPGLYMPAMQDDPEGAVGFASRTHGLALRVVRCVGVDRTLMMRADLLGGTFPSDVGGPAHGSSPSTGPSWIE